MSARMEALKNLRDQWPHKSHARKLTEAQMKLVEDFIREHDALGHLEFEYLVNRWAISLTCDGRKKTTMWELLVSANARVHVKPRSER